MQTKETNLVAHQQGKPGRVLGVFTLSMISVSAIIALRNLPTLAKNGFSVVFILSLASLVFFIPVALSCAELASGWPKKGGVYAWVKEAFGIRSGALAVWLEWIESVVWLPTVLSFIASSIAYCINPHLVEHRYFMLAVMLAVLWSGTFLNFLGTQTSGWVSTVGIIAGSIIPGLAIVALGSYWLTSGQPTHITFSSSTFLPDFSFSSLSYFTVVALGFAGIEVAAFYVQDTKNPQRTFPRATFIAAIIIIVLYVLGALSIAIVIPKDDLHLSAGMMQAMKTFFTFLEIPWAVPLFALLSVAGGLALLNTWILGPSKGLLTSAQNNDLPEFTKYTNRFGSPVAILLMQAIIGTLLISMNLFIPTMNQFYWIFQTQAAQLILMMYFMIFLSVIKLRYTQPDTPRLYQIPGGKIGLWVVAGSGALFCVVAFCLGFIPPEEYQFIDNKTYFVILLSGIIVFSAPPFIWHHHKKKKSHPNH
ncbi:MAG: amino acid permease [Proteobacteria bacterium]|nr:amino acid permease [Pseudomonadota bacterium]